MIKNPRIILAIKVLIVITAVFGVNPFLILFTVPTYLVLAILMAMTNLKRSLKLKWIFVPLILIALTILIGMAMIIHFKL